MAKHRQLMERWRKWKIKSKRTRPKAFSSKSMGGLNKGAMQDAGANAYGHRARSFMGTDILQLLFSLPDNETVRPMDDPRLAVEYKIEYLKQQDPLARVLEFNCLYLEGAADTDRNVRLFFGGREFFFVERKLTVFRRTIVYTDHDRAMRLWNEGRLSWLSPIVIRSNTSTSVAPSPDD